MWGRPTRDRASQSAPQTVDRLVCGACGPFCGFQSRCTKGRIWIHFSISNDVPTENKHRVAAETQMTHALLPREDKIGNIFLGNMILILQRKNRCFGLCVVVQECARSESSPRVGVESCCLCATPEQQCVLIKYTHLLTMNTDQWTESHVLSLLAI